MQPRELLFTFQERNCFIDNGFKIPENNPEFLVSFRTDIFAELHLLELLNAFNLAVISFNFLRPVESAGINLVKYESVFNALLYLFGIFEMRDEK